MKKCIVVLGMHRSGTSALTGVLNMLGVDLGLTLMKPAPENPEGFFENHYLSQCNDKLLEGLSSPWDDLLPLPENWRNNESLEAYKEEIRVVIDRELKSEIIGIKDPRLCRLLPFWIALFKEMNIEPYYIISVRNPLEVAHSLKKRNGFSIEKSVLLWMNHMLNAELYTRSSVRIFISFDRLLRSPENTIGSISKAFGLDFQTKYNDSRKEIEEFLKPNLRHHCLDSNDINKDLLEHIIDYYHLLEKLNSRDVITTDELAEIDAIRDGYFRIYKYFYNDDIKNSLTITEDLKDQLITAKDQLITAKAQIIELKNNLAYINALLGWKLLKKYYRLRDSLLPPGSKSRNMAKFIWRSPGFINKLNITKSLFYIKECGFFHFLQKAKERLKPAQSVTTFSVEDESSYQAWIKKNEPSQKELDAQKKKRFRYEPKISIIVPTSNMYGQFLKDMIESVLSQTYSYWEICIVDGANKDACVREILSEYAGKDRRLKVSVLPANKGIAGNFNEALSLATGNYIALLDHDDLLAPFALFEVVKALNDGGADFLYSDEDMLTEDGKSRDCPHFKPGWSPHTLLSNNYIGRLSVIKKEIIDEIGGYRDGFDGAQDYDLFLRVSRKVKNIFHIPKILYHRRSHQTYASQQIDAKPYAMTSAQRAISEHLHSSDYKDRVSEGAILNTYHISYEIKGNPIVTIIIPTKDKVELLRPCISSILKKTDYLNYKVLVVDNSSIETKTFKYYDEIRQNPKILLTCYNKPFNYSVINNYAVSQIDSDYLLFLNNDTEVINKEWLRAMLEHAQRKEIGAVGAKLYYPDNTVQHAGVIVGLGGVAGHSHKHYHKESSGYINRLKIIQNLSAVTGACLMMRKEVFEEVGGFEEGLSHAYNDVDLCMKIRQKGYFIIWTPYAELYHHESKSRGYDDTPEKKERFWKECIRFQQRWKEQLKTGDPYYNCNLTLDKEDFSIKL